MFILISFIVLLYNIFCWGPQAQFVIKMESHSEKYVVKKRLIFVYWVLISSDKPIEIILMVKSLV